MHPVARIVEKQPVARRPTSASEIVLLKILLPSSGYIRHPYAKYLHRHPYACSEHGCANSTLVLI